MIECLIIGDSIAQGISTYLPQCSSQTKVGINSKNFNNIFINKTANFTIISLGSNDGNLNTFNELIELREKILGNVIWVIPNKLNRLAVKQTADLFKDMVIDTSGVSIQKDNVHPTGNGYKDLSNQIKEKIEGYNSTKIK